MIDGRLDSFGCFSRALAAALPRRFMFIAAGAFMTIYREKLGEVNFAEQIEDLAPLRMEDVYSLQCCHEELLNRLATELVELRPPTRKDIIKRMMAIENDAGVKVDEMRRSRIAERIVKSSRNLRGLEAYAARLLSNKLEFVREKTA